MEQKWNTSLKILFGAWDFGFEMGELHDNLFHNMCLGVS
jgi:hypothetical protein